MKKNFLAGLVILLPVALTFFIILFFINLFTGPFVEIVEKILGSIGIQNLSFLFITHATVLMLFSKLLILLLIFGIIVLTGVLAQGLFKDLFTRSIDYILNKIPGINNLYRAIQEVVSTVFTAEGSAYSSVVLVPFSQENTYSIGLVTSEKMAIGTDSNLLNLISVFVPASPNPTVGFMLLYSRKDLIFIDMKVDDALRYVVSAGVMNSEFNISAPTFNKQDISAK